MLNKVMKKNAVEMVYYSIVPLSGITLSEQLNDCYIQLSKYLNDFGINRSHVVKQTIFISDSNISDYLKSKKILLNSSALFFQNNIPTSIVPQPPLNNNQSCN